MSEMAAPSPYVRGELVPERSAPVKTSGLIGFLRTRLLNSPTNIVLTLLGLLLLWFTVVPALKFLLLDAVWTGTDRDACLADKVGHPVGACWPYIGAKFSQLMFGFYPQAERWRVNLTYFLAAVLLVPLLMPRLPAKGLNAALFFVAFPILAYFLLHGGGLGGPLACWITAAIIAITVFLLSGGLRGERRALVAGLATFAGIGFLIVALGLDRGRLPVVGTRDWGGLLITLVASVIGIVTAIPIGIALALGRRSTIPLIRIFSIAFIEFWRGVPLITVLFFATYMLPLFLPADVAIDGLVRALIGIALFMGAYTAEVLRGGLQAIPRGQEEAASALGLSWARTTFLIVLPQAFRHVIPGLVNECIALFKDTSLVSIVAIFDLLGALQASFSDPVWATPTTLFTGFAFTGMIYFVFCFGMSRYSLFVENRLNAHRRT